jgi:hypothetical protein
LHEVDIPVVLTPATAAFTSKLRGREILVKVHAYIPLLATATTRFTKSKKMLTTRAPNIEFIFPMIESTFI